MEQLRGHFPCLQVGLLCRFAPQMINSQSSHTARQPGSPEEAGARQSRAMTHALLFSVQGLLSVTVVIAVLLRTQPRPTTPCKRLSYVHKYVLCPRFEVTVHVSPCRPKEVINSSLYIVSQPRSLVCGHLASGHPTLPPGRKQAKWAAASAKAPSPGTRGAVIGVARLPTVGTYSTSVLWYQCVPTH